MKKPCANSNKVREGGFSLPEVLVALLILSMTFVPLSSVMTWSVKSLKHLENTKQNLLQSKAILETAYSVEGEFNDPQTQRKIGSITQFAPKIEIKEDCRFDVVGRRCR